VVIGEGIEKRKPAQEGKVPNALASYKRERKNTKGWKKEL